MRWEDLFDDLEGSFEEQERVQAEAELIDLVRAERDRIAFTDRLRAHPDALVSLDLRDGSTRRGTILDVGRDWVLLRNQAGTAGFQTDLLVPVPAVVSAGGLSQFALGADGAIGRRLRIGTVLRGLARNRSPVGIDLWPGGHLDGTIDRVGSDHLDLAVHPPDLARRNSAVRQVRVVLFQAVAAVAVPVA